MLRQIAAGDRRMRRRMQEMHELIELLTSWFADVERLDNKSLVQLLNLGSKVQKVLELKGKLTRGLKGKTKPARRGV